MRSTPRNTANARRVISPRLPIGVATRWRPGAGACPGPSARGQQGGEGASVASAGARACSGLLARGARLGSAPALLLPLEAALPRRLFARSASFVRSEEHTSELQSRFDLVCRLLL